MTKRNILLFLLAVYAFVAYVLPFLHYSFDAFDRHYFGYFNELEPRLALTTKQQTFYTDNMIPFTTIEQVEEDRLEAQKRKALGLPTIS